MLKEKMLSEWDNFQQYWQEHTEEEMHRVDIEKKHRHLNLIFEKTNQDDIVKVSIREGRNAQDEIAQKIIALSAYQSLISDASNTQLEMTNVFDEVSHLSPYQFEKCRHFSGWIQCPISEGSEELYSQRGLILHDQGSMVELDFEGAEYTVELTQLVYAKKIYIMKLAIYDLPMSRVEINSRAISYTWADPAAKRLGINLRKLISGWTLIES